MSDLNTSTVLAIQRERKEAERKAERLHAEIEDALTELIEKAQRFGSVQFLRGVEEAATEVMFIMNGGKE